MIPKPQTLRAPKYLAFIRRQGCCICQRPAEAHHTETGGVGMRGSDLSCIPLCRAHHMEYHDKGRRSWQVLHNATLAEIRETYLRRFIQEEL